MTLERELLKVLHEFSHFDLNKFPMPFHCTKAVETGLSGSHKINYINYFQARRNEKHSGRRGDATSLL